MCKEKIYLGKYYGEEMYINLCDKKLTGWSLLGLRPETESVLRARARQTEPEDIGLTLPDFAQRWFDYESFYDDMEEDWIERHDSQGEYHINDETYYLGFGLGTDIFNHFEDLKINQYSDLVDLWDDVVITEEQFNKLMEILETYSKDETTGYKDFLLWCEDISEYPPYTDEYKEEQSD